MNATLSSPRPITQDRARRRTKRGWWRTAIVVVVGLLINLPLFNAVITSFKTDGDIATSPFSFERGFTLDHYVAIFGGSGYDFTKFLMNSAFTALGTVVLVMVIAVPASYAIVRLGFGGSALLNFITSLRLVPAMFFAIPFFLMLSAFGLYDSIPALVLANTFLNLPLAMLIICGAVREVPIDVEEAAVIDGASAYRTLGSIVLPLLAPGLVAVGILVFLFTWSDYLFAVILSSSQATPVTVGAAFFVTSAGIAWGNVSAVVVVSLVIPLSFAIFAQRYLVRGLSAGAVK
ncbi:MULTISPECIES: carbohydrate ABC transporter permease [unclassified Cryobacterium]|uniref:carbohydrate ABC transporter permease n=1 Tax=unclassified Cryobacterium TaxID=2649013 RepID=UPI00106CC835|nr:MULTISPECIES: carbohydrate ABC transporter permease [unclassified Cryobacterium]TFD07816.1 carbohydrate ABC transporter permease [Cryobacterium sp. TMT1-66-1]TFD07899.1 carbohydrate ABC transporter permease [Cryobacterium sp. TMT1-2-2]